MIIAEYNQKKKELKEKEEKLKSNIIIRENELFRKEKEFKEKEKLITNAVKKENEFAQKEEKLKEKEKELIKNIIKREKEVFEKEKIIKMKENELKLRENNLELKQDELIKIKNSNNNKLLNKIKELEKEIKILKKEPIIVGLNNIGATCYMNATLQCLSNTKELSDYFLNEYNYEKGNNKKIMSNEFYKVNQNLWDENNNNGSFSPNEFKEKLSQENPLFAGIAANDSKDLINFLIERIHNELNIINNNINCNYISNLNDQLYETKMLDLFINEFNIKFNSIISRLFYGILETRSQCQNCKTIKYNFQIFSFIEFPLEKVNIYCYNTGKRANYNFINNNYKNPDVDLYECFEYYSINELMTGDNQMYCNICKQSYDALYGTLLYSLPNYLIINLNRGRGAVYECNVNFPEKLNLLNFVSFKTGNTFYELYAVICHIGPSSMSGHFIAYCKNKIDRNWYKYNDSMVSICTEPNEYRSGMPYILFYQAK